MKEGPQISSHQRPWRASRLEVEECLRGFGLHEKMRRVSTAIADDTQRRSRRIRIALPKLGPVFVAFGLYLSSRNDLLPAGDCLELASLPDAAEPMTSSEVETLIAAECGYCVTKAFLYFDPEPSSSRLVSQSHTALLLDGSAVTLRLIRPRLRKHFEDDLHLLHLLKPAFTCDEWPDFNLDYAIAAFERNIRSQIDLIQQAGFCEAMALDARNFDQLRVPAPHRTLCSSGMLTSERILGSPLTDVLAGTEENAELERSRIARQLWLVWLHQVLLGRAFPVEPQTDNVLLLPSGQLAFVGGSICPAARDSTEALTQYLIAVLNEDPDQACLALLQQSTPTESQAGSMPLRNSFRQVTSLRYGDWRLGHRTDCLAERLLVHWQLLHKHGYKLSDPLTSFYRALFLINQCCRQLVPDQDLLRVAVEQLRATLVFDQFREGLPLHDWKNGLGRYAGLMLELPKRVDDLLSVAADGTPVLRIKIDEPVADNRKSKLAEILLILCVAFAALMMFPEIMPPLSSSLRTERAVLIVALLMLSFLLRSER